MAERLTDRAAVRLALIYAIEWEESCIHSYLDLRHGWSEDLKAKFPLEPEVEEMLHRWRLNIDAFKRVLDRYFDGARRPKIAGGKPIPLSKIVARDG